ncbi:Rieske (2Fe-2S) protein [Micromonospora echinofusca]|uniref:Cytochrome bc1 complex Rieske iron-sulfur subunit n=1 Tax=Micromonospora echinofusca TaxID=47858 RepID=A0ABS3VZ51_MICEH|nr:Rieske (2Fe-2S) protein [Micromonospora echinofusca]MBO4209644.1 Rieske 2Fe-2S domain-containing protein [Micromonospora echinofusca]
MSDEQMSTGQGGRTRRALLTGAGAVGASVVLAACGDDAGTDDAGSPTAGGGPTSGGPPVSPSADAGADRGAAALARTADIPVGGGRIYAEKGVVITQPTAGEFKGFDPICTHQRCPVANVDGGTINCTCHNSRFSIADGSVKAGPAPRPLPQKQIKVEGDQIMLA